MGTCTRASWQNRCSPTRPSTTVHRGGRELKSDGRWNYGVPPSGTRTSPGRSTSLYHLAPDGYAGVVLANGLALEPGSGEGRKKSEQGVLFEAITVSEEGKQIPTTLESSIASWPCRGSSPLQRRSSPGLWFFTRTSRMASATKKLTRPHRRQILFIDARNLGTMASRTHGKEADGRRTIARVAETYHAWREKWERDSDVPGFAKSASLRQVADPGGFVLTPGR